MSSDGSKAALVPGSNGATAYSAGTSSFGAGIAVIFVWILNLLGITVPNEVAMAFVVVFTTGSSYLLRFLPQRIQPSQPSRDVGNP